jgi:hypothetical protein
MVGSVFEHIILAQTMLLVGGNGRVVPNMKYGINTGYQQWLT